MVVALLDASANSYLLTTSYVEVEYVNMYIYNDYKELVKSSHARKKRLAR